MAALLDPLTSQQQRLVDLVADAFVNDNDWPVFDYLLGRIDEQSDQTENAAQILASYPRFGLWGYGAVWWPGVGQVGPDPGAVVGLTVLGAARSSSLQGLVDVFFEVIGLMIHRWRNTPVSTRAPREIKITNEDVEELLNTERRITQDWPLRLYKLLEREPFFASSASLDPSTKVWTKLVPREVYEYEGVATIDDYVRRLERLTALPESPAVLATPSALNLVAALDYLDAVWRAEHDKRHLFSYPSAEKTAKLSYPPNTREEFDSRLSALGEILRSARDGARDAAGVRLAGASPEHPLAPFEDYLAGRVAKDAEARIRSAVTELESAVAIRDAAQHTEAGDRAVRALEEFGIGYPIDDVPRAWDIVTAHVVEALGAIREELSSK